MVCLKINPDQLIFCARIKAREPFRQREKNRLARVTPSIELIRKKCWVQLSQFVASEFGYRFINHGTGEIHSCFW